eukprot:7044755-Pyramimonas_sp.AAC.1
MTVTVLRHAGVRCSSLRIKNLVGDISLHSIGGPQTVARELSFAFKETVGLLQARGPPLSWDKVGRGQYHRDLGGDAVDGRYRRIGTQLTRIRDAMAKGDRLLALKGLGRQRSAVHRSGILSKALRGCSIAWVPNSRIQQLRMSFLNAGARFKPENGWHNDPLVIATSDAIHTYIVIMSNGTLTSSLVSALM